jgi:Arc/MetJ family transcription regulator
MATNLKIDPDLLNEALKLSGCRTKKDAVTQALTEFVARRRQRNLLKLAGKFDFDPDYDPKQQRNRP